MKKIGDITNTADKNGEFTDGNVAAGTPPTQLMGAWFNSVQREILNVLAKAGVPQSATKEDQLAEAITKIVAGAGYLPTGYSYSKRESDDKYSTKNELTTGLNDRLPITRPEASESLIIKSVSDYANLSLRKKAGSAGERVDIETMPNANNGSLNIIYRDKDGKNVAITVIPKKSGTMMHIGDYGIGNNGVSGEGLVNSPTTPVGFYAMSSRLGASPQGIGGDWSFIQAPAANVNYRSQLGFSDRGGSAGSLFIRSFNEGKPTDWARFYHDKNTISDRNGNIKIAGSSSELSDFPVGAPIPWPQSTAPTGYLICNGQTFNKATFPILAKAYPSGVLPDLRGEFIRGLDAGRNVDSGRAVLSSQGDAMRSLSGSARLQGTESISQETGVFKNAGTFQNVNSGHGTGNSNSKILGFDTSDVTPTANENRPRNIAFLYIVRAA